MSRLVDRGGDDLGIALVIRIKATLRGKFHAR